MHPLLSFGVVAGLLVVALAAPARAAGPEPLHSLVEGYVADQGRLDPLWLERLGKLDGADRLPDVSAAGHAARIASLRAWRAKFAAAPANESLDDRADRRAVLDGIDRTLIGDEALAAWRSDPAPYIGTISAAVFQPIVRDDEPLDARMSHVATRLAGIPAIVDAAIANLDGHPTKPAAELAVMQIGALKTLYTKTLPAAAAGASPAVRARLEAATPAAVAAIDRFRAFAAGPLLARADRDPRIGRELYDKLFAITIGTDITPDALAQRARDRIAATRAEMYRLAKPLVAAAHPQISQTDEQAVIRAALDDVAAHRPNRTTFLPVIRDAVADTEAFLRSSGFVTLPEPDTLHVRPTPEFQAGVAGASMESAGPFAPQRPAFYNVDPFPASWDDARVDSYLREYNDSVVRVLTIHEAIPGHYVQLRYANQVPSLARRVFGNGSFIEGYACYVEGAMLDAGYRSGDVGLRLSQLKWRLREATNALLDIEYHRGTLTEEAAMNAMTDGAFQETAEAAGKWHRLQLSHVQLATYFAGLSEIEDGEKKSGLDRRAYIAKLLQIGSVEPRFIAPLVAAR